MNWERVNWDQLNWQPLPMETADGSTAAPSLKRELTFPLGENQRSLTLGMPAVVRRLDPTRLGSHWSELCKILRSFGIPISATVQQFETLPAAHVPLRIARRHVDARFDEHDLTTADLFEVDCRRAVREPDLAAWAWPAELGSDKRLSAMLAAIRCAAGGNVPIGVVLKSPAAEVDLQLAIEAGADFLTFVDLGQQPGTDLLRTLVAAQTVSRKTRGTRLPIIVEAAIYDSSQLLKCVALGASMVSVDWLLSSALAQASKPRIATGSGMLSGILTTNDQAPSLAGVKQTLSKLKSDLCRELAVVGAQKLDALGPELLK